MSECVCLFVLLMVVVFLCGRLVASRSLEEVADSRIRKKEGSVAVGSGLAKPGFNQHWIGFNTVLVSRKPPYQTHVLWT
jgi:hypothetical protein